MTAAKRRGLELAMLVVTSAAVAHPVRNGAKGGGATTRTVFAGPMPGLKGDHLTATVMEVTYGPGGASSPHSHGCPVIVYVLEGAIRTQVKGQPEAIYRPGQTFLEHANEVHLVSANASATEPARFLAIFTCDSDAPLSRPEPAPSATAGAR